jgi:septal ring factor EnvC (AmiA/AmiB activator)
VIYRCRDFVKSGCMDVFISRSSQVRTPEGGLEQLKTEIEHLTTEIKQKKTKIEQLKTDIEQLKTEIEQLNTEM